MHTQRDQKKLVSRVRRIRGQLEAVEKAIDAEKNCSEILQTVAAARGAIDGLVNELIADHIRFHVLPPEARATKNQREAEAELLDVLRSYLK